MRLAPLAILAVLAGLLAAAPIAAAAMAADNAPGADVGCYSVYTRNDVGQLTVIRRTSCSVPEFYWCPTPGAPPYDCDPLIS